ncbi:MAG: hypothetical protein JST75_04560 [Bacteroidetes bacterium]|nr:hypothetical protein [Bacteroidota bacterium]
MSFQKVFKILSVAICLFLFTAAKASCQSKIEKYCIVEAYHKNGFSTKISIRLVNGEVDSLFSFADSAVKNNLAKIKELNSIPDALNYMANLGWTLVTATTFSTGGSTNLYFKKEFEKSELAK